MYFDPSITRQDDQPSTLCMCIQSEAAEKERVLRMKQSQFVQAPSSEALEDT